MSLYHKRSHCSTTTFYNSIKLFDFLSLLHLLNDGNNLNFVGICCTIMTFLFSRISNFLRLNPLLKDTILDWSKLKAFADDKINVTKKFNFVLGRVENIVEKKKKMLVTSIFSFSHNVFKSLLLQVG